MSGIRGEAERLLGLQFVEGGTDPDVGLDCRGLAHWLLTAPPPRGLGFKVPPSPLWGLRSIEEVERSIESLIAENAASFPEIACGATHELGDLAESRAPGGANHRHLSVCVTPGSHGCAWYATTSRGTGVVVRRWRQLGGVLRRYRFENSHD